MFDRVVVRRNEDEIEKKGSIFIPDSAKEKPMRGEVVAAGPGKRLDDGKIVAPDVKAGDQVLFGKYSGSDVTVDDEELLILREEEILGILE
jgi:chaperonin GroES